MPDIEEIKWQIDQAIDEWLIENANDGTDLALRRANIRGDRLKARIHTILEET